MIRAFELAVRQLGDPKLRGIIWWSLLVSLLLQVGIAVLAWWALHSFAHFEWKWINEAIVWLGGGAVVVLALMLFPASFGIVISIFMEKIADIVEAEHYPELGPARGIPIWTGIWTGVVFLLAVVALNLVMLPFYIVAIFVAGLGAVLFYAVNGWLTGRVYYEQVALRRRSPGRGQGLAPRQFGRAVAHRHRHRFPGHHPDPEPDRAGAGRGGDGACGTNAQAAAGARPTL